VGAVFYNPVEILKCRAQVNREGSVKYRTLIADIMATEGWIGMYRGFLPLVLRELPAWSSYFWSYEYLKHMTGLNEKGKNGVTLGYSDTLTRMFCGGCAGMISWLVSYPFDVLKTHIQT
jgi:solute carrier family 25 carnitine/acylcarnitine transporter 20/29